MTKRTTKPRTPKPNLTLETDFMRRLIADLPEVPGVTVWRQNTGSVTFNEAVHKNGRIVLRKRTFKAGPPAGAADISGIHKPSGRRIEIETKSQRGKLSAEQESWRNFIVEAGGIYLHLTYDESISLEENSYRGKVSLCILVNRTAPKCDCCDRGNEYNGFASGPLLFVCPKSCPCHD